MDRSRNLAARAGRWSAQHRKKAIFGWLGFVIVAFAIGGSVGTNTLDQADSGVGDSGRASKLVDDHFPKKADESVLVQSKTLVATDARFKAAVADVVARIRRVPNVRAVESPYTVARGTPISRDGHSALVGFDILGDEDQVKDRVDPALAAVAAAQKRHPGLRIEEFGDASADKALSKVFEDDFRKAEFTSLPITLAILLLAFGALVAAGVPLLLAISAVLATLGLLGPISQIWAVDEAISSVVLLIGLAVGVDYSMFYLRREREERAAGRSEEASLQAAAATSGRAVMISGFTVMIAMAGMYLAGAATFRSFATGTILVVAVAVLGSLTVLPAVLSKLGDRVDKGQIPGLARLKRRRSGRGLWAALVDRVLRRPILSALLAGGFLVALAIPAFGLHTAVSGIDDLPRSVPEIRTYDRIQAAFPGNKIPAEVVVQADEVTSPQIRGAIKELRDRALLTNGLLRNPISVDVSPDHKIAEVSIPVAGDGSNDTSFRALTALRDDVIPESFGDVQVKNVYVGGTTAQTEDFNDVMKSHVVGVFAFVLSAAFLLLLITFRSIVIPIKAILLNLLSVGAAYGLLVLIFQHGWFESILGFTTPGSITAWLPLFLFVVLFGLSMDYHVFILTRVREAFDRGRSTEDAVAHGIETTAGVVTSAAIVMVAVFAIFATLSNIDFKEMGVGLAAAVLIDATVIRGVLLPASMKLLGDWNWYLPKWLEWLPRVTPEEPPPEAEPEPAREREPEPAGV